MDLTVISFQVCI